MRVALLAPWILSAGLMLLVVALMMDLQEAHSLLDVSVSSGDLFAIDRGNFSSSSSSLDRGNFSSSSSSKCRLFIYDAFEDVLGAQRSFSSELVRKFSETPVDTQVMCHSSGVHQSILHSGMLVDSIQEADLVYVPFYLEQMYAVGRIDAKLTAPWNLVRQRLFDKPVWKEFPGRFVFSAGQVQANTKFIRPPQDEAVWVVNDPLRAENFPEDRRIIVPYMLYGPKRLLNTTLRAELARNTEKKYFLFFAGSYSEPEERAHRTRLLEESKALLANTTGEQIVWYNDPKVSRKPEDYESIILASRYCLCPLGHVETSLRQYQVSFLGCVPVHLADGMMFPFEAQIGPYSDFSVILPESISLVEMVRHLQAIPDEQYRRMQDRLLEVSDRFSWRWLGYDPETGADARTLMKGTAHELFLEELCLKSKIARAKYNAAKDHQNTKKS